MTSPTRSSSDSGKGKTVVHGTDKVIRLLPGDGIRTPT